MTVASTLKEKYLKRLRKLIYGTRMNRATCRINKVECDRRLYYYREAYREALM